MTTRARRLLQLLAWWSFLFGAVALRLHPAVVTTSAAGLDFLDADTVRRLVRLRALDTATEYPLVEPADGFPQGTRIQWTLPMDQVIRGLDALAPRWHPAALRYETGAALAGPVLGGLAVLAFALLARRLLPAGRAALACVCYATSAPVLEATRLGNGDHQSLQHLCAVLVVPGTLALLLGRGGTGLALLVGAALGLNLWVSAEALLLLALAALLITLGLVTLDHATARARLRQLLWLAGACAGVTVIGQLVESGGALTLEWDRISCFQGAAALALPVFLGLLHRLDRRGMRRWPALLVAASLTLAMTLGPFVLVPTLRARLLEQLAAARALSAFATACVAEYHPLFANGAALARLAFNDTVFLAPLCLLALWWARDLPPVLRVGLAAATSVFAALLLDQVKLSQLFAIPWALLLPVGLTAGVDTVLARLRRPELALRLRQAGAALVAAHALWTIIAFSLTPPDAGDRAATADRQAVVAALAQLPATAAVAPAAERPAVMAPWELAPYLLYADHKPIVASSYQRRVDGIRDSFDVLCSPTPEAAQAILLRCRARYWVRPGDPSFLFQAHRAFPGRKELARLTQEPDRLHIGLDPTVAQTFWARTAAGTPPVPWLELVFESPRVSSWWGAFQGPPFRVFRIRYPDEPR